MKASAPPAGDPHLLFLSRGNSPVLPLGCRLSKLTISRRRKSHRHDLMPDYGECLRNGRARRQCTRRWQISRQMERLQSCKSCRIALLQPLLNSLSFMSLELRASLMIARGNREQAKYLFLNAARQEKALGYGEPPSYIRPVGDLKSGTLQTISPRPFLRFDTKLPLSLIDGSVEALVPSIRSLAIGTNVEQVKPLFARICSNR